MTASRAKTACDALAKEEAGAATICAQIEMDVIGCLLYGYPGTREAFPSIRAAASRFVPIYARVVDAVAAAMDGGADYSPSAIALRMATDLELKELGGRDHLLEITRAAPAIASAANGQAQIERKLGTHAQAYWRLECLQKERQLQQAISDRSPEVGILAAELARLTAAGADGLGRVRLVAFDDIALSDARRDLVKGLVPRVGLCVVWGPPKCGKSFFAFDLAMHVALGWEYRGRRVQQGPVVYCAFEGQTGMEARAAAFRRRFMARVSDPVPFYLQPIRLDLVADHTELVACIRAEMHEQAPALVVLDTLNRSIHGSESDDRDMSAYVAAADSIREAFQCLVLIVHHCGIDATRPRGHTSLSGAVEVQLAVKRDTGGNVLVDVELAKDGPSGDSIVSQLEVVDVGTDEDGETITSCVVVPSEADPTQGKARISGAAKIALQFLDRALDDAPQTAPPNNHIPPKAQTTLLSVWRSYCDVGTVSESENPDSKRKAFVRACNALQSQNLIGIWGDFVWRK